MRGLFIGSPMMVTVSRRAAIAWIVLQFVWQGVAAQDSSPERPPALERTAAPAAATPVPVVGSPTPPTVPGPSAPTDPLGTVKAAPSDAVRPPGPAPKAGDVSGATPSPARSIGAPSPAASGGRKPLSLDIDVPTNLVGPNADTLRRQLAPGSAPATSPALRALKRLTPQEILTASHDVFSIYVLRDSERTLILDFPNTREQSKMFARLILFIERAGASKTRVMTVPEVQKWLTQNSLQFDTLTVGNNMRTSELARFFNSARFQGEPITVDEQRLYDWLVQWQLLREEDAGVSVVDPERILVSVPQVSSVPGCAGCTVNAAQRAAILQHELSHARFATDTVYQNYSLWFWSNAMSLVSRDKFTRFLRSRGYDTSIRELSANEMQAFLMNTPDPAMFSATDIGVTDAELADLRRRFQEGIAPKPRAAADRPYQFD